MRNQFVEKCVTVPVGISERLMKFKIPLTIHRYATILSVYAPTLTAEGEYKDQFYGLLDQELNRVPFTTKLMLLSDFNVRVETYHVAWSGDTG